MKALLIVLLLTQAIAFAELPLDTGHLEEAASAPHGESTSPPSLSVFAGLGRLIGAFLLVLLLMGGLLFVVRRFATPASSGAQPVKLLFEESIGQKRSICLVQVGDQILVVGATSSNVSYLTRIEDAELRESLQREATDNASWRRNWDTLRAKFGVF